MQGNTETIPIEKLSFIETNCNLCGLGPDDIKDFENCTTCGKRFCYPHCLRKHQADYNHKQAKVRDV